VFNFFFSSKACPSFEVNVTMPVPDCSPRPASGLSAVAAGFLRFFATAAAAGFFKIGMAESAGYSKDTWHGTLEKKWLKFGW
jgi:hypothetical protein